MTLSDVLKTGLTNTDVHLTKQILLKSTPTTVAEHFRSHNHRYTDMQLIPVELIHSPRDSIRKARESFLIDLAGTLEPHGLNKRDEL